MAECVEALRIDKKCSEVTCRHDPAAAKTAPIPDPTELLQDLGALKALVDQVKDRRKASKVSVTAAPGGAI
jgi:hypothetical protein